VLVFFPFSLKRCVHPSSPPVVSTFPFFAIREQHSLGTMGESFPPSLSCFIKIHPPCLYSSPVFQNQTGSFPSATISFLLVLVSPPSPRGCFMAPFSPKAFVPFFSNASTTDPFCGSGDWASLQPFLPSLFPLPSSNFLYPVPLRLETDSASSCPEQSSLPKLLTLFSFFFPFSPPPPNRRDT